MFPRSMLTIDPIGPMFPFPNISDSLTPEPCHPFCPSDEDILFELSIAGISQMLVVTQDCIAQYNANGNVSTYLPGGTPDVPSTTFLLYEENGRFSERLRSSKKFGSTPAVKYFIAYQLTRINLFMIPFASSFFSCQLPDVPDSSFLSNMFLTPLNMPNIILLMNLLFLLLVFL